MRGGLHIPKLEIPRIEVPDGAGLKLIELGPAHKSDYLRDIEKFIAEHDPIAGAASFSDYLENKVNDHVNGKTSFTMPATTALALCTVVPTDASTGATITEAAYTGYARKVVAGADWNASASGSATTANQLQFAACTGSSSTVIGWAYLDSSTTGAGNVLYWGTCTSTVISSTQTPATIAAGALSLALD